MKLSVIDSVEQARQKLMKYAESIRLTTEKIPFEDSMDRIAAENVFSIYDIPAFNRSAVDGFAVISKDTAAVSESLPSMLTQTGDIRIGEHVDFCINSGECAYVPTGGMLPKNADAVVMVEYSESFGGDGIALYKPAAFGENVVFAGEDIRSGGLLIKKGKKIRASEIGALAAAGLKEVSVYKPLRLTIISTGDELTKPGEQLSAGRVYDINTYTLKALAEKNGFKVVNTALLPDDRDLLEQTVRNALLGSDIVTISGGSSRGKADYTGEVLEKISSPGVFTWGIAVKPGKPTIFAYDKPSETLLAGLPGHPVSAMIVFEAFICDFWRKLTGCENPRLIPARLTVNVPSSPGKHTFCPVRLFV
ncbi:molybdopterin biosynthesis protein [Holotrichia oblita]|nr:molybdopterin biosynthesis protein [Holotrichia oblita]